MKLLAQYGSAYGHIAFNLIKGSRGCVSDWSGTPQRGNPREEYSGKRDPAAFEPGHAQRQTHGEVLFWDEAHRTTGGDLGNFLLAGLPNAIYLGITCTPIDKTAYGRGT